MQKVIVICGPTAIGKSHLALQLATKYQGEIISGDSMQVYRGMHIGTAKPSKEELALVPHHLIDICALSETFSVADFQTRVRQIIAEIHKRGRLPILVGGTGLYLKAALYDYQFPTTQDVLPSYDHLSTQEMWQTLTLHAPHMLTTIHPNNRKRLLRAYAMFQHRQAPKKAATQPMYHYLCIGLTSDRDTVYQRINQRVLAMIEQGLEEEARNVLATPNLSVTARQAIGYKEWIPYFQQQISLPEVISSIQQATRRYAKRQYTWFSNQFDLHWFDVQQPGYLEKIHQEVEVFLHE